MLSNHAELAGKVIDGRSFISGESQTNYRDDSGHGTAVASLIAGNITGVAPGVTLHALRVLIWVSVDKPEDGDQTTAVNAINWLIQNKPAGFRLD